MQSLLASGAVEDRFRDLNPCVEIPPWRRSCIATGGSSLAGEKCPRSSSFTVCIAWFYPPVNGTAEFCS